MLDKVSKERIKQLKKEKKYNEIFVEFGQKNYKKYVPNKIKREDLSKLKKEGKYEDIYNKYGESIHNSLLIKAMYREIKETQGIRKATAWRIKKGILNTAKALGIYTVLGFSEITLVGALATQMDTIENSIKYESEIEDYDNSISDYANKVNSQDLSDIQVFMKVMDDMWKNIKGYGTPQKDIRGFLELDLATPEGYGVCRNMASDIKEKLNKINPKYNARTITAKMGKDGFYQIADIERNIVETNETVVEESNKQSDNNEELDNFISKIVGNHAVTLVDIPEYNLTVVLDPTNPGIGIYQDGQIKMFNSGKEDGLKFEAKEWSNVAFFQGGIHGIVNTAQDYINSYQKSTLSLEEIEEKFGIEAQNKALKEVREMYKEDIELSKGNKELDKGKSEEKESTNKESDFRESLKVDIDGIEENLQEVSKDELKENRNNQEKSEAIEEKEEIE
jgi:hypothetical protein